MFERFLIGFLGTALLMGIGAGFMAAFYHLLYALGPIWTSAIAGTALCAFAGTCNALFNQNRADTTKPEQNAK